MDVEEFLAGFGATLAFALYGKLVAELLTDAARKTGNAFAFKGDAGNIPLDGSPS